MSCPTQICCLPMIFPAISLPTTVRSFSVDDGTDPILGPPYPPQNYEFLARTEDQPSFRTILDWNVPDVFIQADLVTDSPGGAIIYLSNYTQKVSAASQTADVVTVAGGDFVFIDTATNHGQTIAWPTGQTAIIDIVTDAHHAIVDTIQDVPAGKFAVMPANTVFRLYKGVPVYDGGSSNFIASSDGGVPFPPDIIQSTWFGAEAGFGPIENQGMPGFAFNRTHDPGVVGTFGYFVTATSGSTILTSNGVSVTINPFIP